MNLIIDFGNSNTKAALFEQEKLLEVFPEVHLESLASEYQDNRVERIFVSTVSENPEDIRAAFKRPLEFLSHKTPLPFNNLYSTPETLGLDRIAAVAGAEELYPELNVLVIDIGTCITYDFMKEGKNYLGGSISPGLQMRFEALHTLTAGLPRVEFDPESQFIGDSTKSSITSGVLYGMQGEIQSMVDRYTADFGRLQTILCGGGAKFFENRLKGAIFAAPELVLRGLNRILLYNAS